MTTTTTTDTAPAILEHLTAEANAEIERRGAKIMPRDLSAELRALGTKRCPGCETVHPLESFPGDSSRPDGLSARCSGCNADKCQRYYAETAETRRSKYREYYGINREREIQRGSAYYFSHRLDEQLSAGYRRAVEAGNPAEGITAEELVSHWESVGIDPFRSIYSGAELSEFSRSLDHSVPISKGGGHTLDNIVPCTNEENRSKFTRTGVGFVLSRPARELDPEDLPELVKRALSTTVPERAKRSVLVQLEEGADHE